MTSRKTRSYRVTADSTIEDVDLDATDVHLSDGRRLTESLAEELAADTIRRGVGRPSLSGERARSPHLGVRVSPELHQRVQERAAREGKPTSEIVREALEHYV